MTASDIGDGISEKADHINWVAGEADFSNIGWGATATQAGTGWGVIATQAGATVTQAGAIATQADGSSVEWYHR